MIDTNLKSLVIIAAVIVVLGGMVTGLSTALFTKAPVVNVMVPDTSNTDSGSFGAINNATSTITNPFLFTQGFAVGTTTSKTTTTASSTPKVTRLIFGTCDLKGMDVSQAATTSVAYPCQLASINTGDRIFASFATGTPMHTSGWVIGGAVASSSRAGWADVVITNLTGTNRVPSASAVGSSTNIFGWGTAQ